MEENQEPVVASMASVAASVAAAAPLTASSPLPAFSLQESNVAAGSGINKVYVAHYEHWMEVS